MFAAVIRNPEIREGNAASGNPYNGGMKRRLPAWTQPRLTRRALAGWMAAPVFLGASAQAQAPVTVSADPAVASARGRYQSAARQLAAVKLARNIEPASRFEA